MRPSVTVDKRYGDIRPCNICSGHNSFGQDIFFWPIIFQTKFFLPNNIFRPPIFFPSKFLDAKIFWTRIFPNHNFFFWDKTFFWLLIIFTQNFLEVQIFFYTKNFWISIFATLGLHFGFSTKLKIWQVPTCKKEWPTRPDHIDFSCWIFSTLKLEFWVWVKINKWNL